MHFGHLNVNSLLTKIEELRTPVFNTNIFVLGIAETKLDNTASNEELKTDGYNLLRSDRDKNDGEVACYNKNNIAHNQQSSTPENIDNIILDILLPKSKPITVGIIYRSPNQIYFIDRFNNALGRLLFQSNEIYLLGDFNINLFFEGHYVLKKYFKRPKEAELKHRLLRPDIESLFSLWIMIIDHILTNF